MDYVGCPEKYLLICMEYVVGLLNVHTISKGAIPNSIITRETTNILPYMSVHFWQEVFVEKPKGGKQLAHWCRPKECIDDFLTYWVLRQDTGQLVAHSNICPVKDPVFPNRNECQSLNPGDTLPPTSKPVVQSISDYFEDSIHLPVFSPEELVGMTFLHDTRNGQTIHAKVVQQILNRDAADHQAIKFLLSMNDGELETIIAYNELSDIIVEQQAAQEEGRSDLHSFKKILDYQGPFKQHDPKYKGSTWNILVNWEDGTQTWEPLNIIGELDPVTMAKFAMEHDVLNKPGWHFLRRTAKRLRFLNVAVHAAKCHFDPHQIQYKFGVRIPHNYQESLQLDKENGNSLWAEAVCLEMEQMDYPADYIKISVLLVFDVKSERRRKGRLVARSDFTPEPDEAVNSSVASLRSLWAVTFLGELNHLKLMAGDVGNVYLESDTNEKVYIISGPEFGPLVGHTLLIDKPFMAFVLVVCGIMRNFLILCIPSALLHLSLTATSG